MVTPSSLGEVGKSLFKQAIPLLGKSLFIMGRVGGELALRNPTVGMGKYVVGGAVAGGIYGAFSDDTSVLGGAILGSVIGSGLMHGRMAGGAALRAASKGTGLRGFGREYLSGYYKTQGRFVRQAARSARNIGGLLSSHLPFNPIKGLSSSSDKWIRAATSYGRRSWGAGHAISGGASIFETLKNLYSF